MIKWVIGYTAVILVGLSLVGYLFFQSHLFMLIICGFIAYFGGLFNHIKSKKAF